MRIRMRCSDRSDDIGLGNVDLVLAGPAVDDRGNAALNALSGTAAARVCLQYDAEHLRLQCDSVIIECDEFATWLQSRAAKSILLEATTLGFAEIVLSCRAAMTTGIAELSFLYLEPGDYFAPRREQALHKRDFDLSHETIGYTAIPGSAYLLEENRQQVVFFCGYEGERLDQAFESLKLVPESCSVVFGVPAFRPGWEMNTFANILPVIRDREINGGVEFCGADNPAAAHGLLQRCYSTKRNDQQIFVAPIGTKPHGIGVALFAAEHDDIGLLYDHPLRRSDRTSRSGRWHLFIADWSAS